MKTASAAATDSAITRRAGLRFTSGMVPGRNIAGAGLVGKGMRGRSLGVLFATTTAVTWGGQFVVGKSALETVNAFPLSTVRYAVAAALWLVVLVVVEGRDALRLDGRGLRLLWLGSL